MYTGASSLHFASYDENMHGLDVFSLNHLFRALPMKHRSQSFSKARLKLLALVGVGLATVTVSNTEI